MHRCVTVVSCVCLLFTVTRAVNSASSSPETFEEQRAIQNCDYYLRKSKAPLSTVDGLQCVTATEADRVLDTKRLELNGFDMYTTYKGLTDYETTFCYSNKTNGIDIKISNDNPDKVARYELTACRAGGYWTNGKIFCEPPECQAFTQQPLDIDYFRQELSLTVNMFDVNNFPNDTVFIKFMGTPDDRLVYDVQSNTSTYYTTQQFLDLCDSDGPCFKGRFIGNDNLLYSQGGRPPFAVKKMGDKVIIGLRYDPRPFVYPESLAPRRCRYEEGKSWDMCDSPAGTQSWKILWESRLPSYQEWMQFTFDIKWSEKHDCKIALEVDNQRFHFHEPCGRYSDMKLGNYPFPKIGIYTGSGVGDHQIRFRDIKFNQNFERK